MLLALAAICAALSLAKPNFLTFQNLILNPCEVEASSPAVDRALAAGIPIVNVNSETKSIPTAFIGSRDEESVRIAMEYIAKRLNGQGNVVMMHGFMGQAAQLKRDQGARDVLAKYPNLKLLADQTAEWDRAKALTLMDAIADALQAVGEGRLDATVFQDAQGQGATAVETAVKIVKKEPCARQVYIPFQLVTKDNIGQFLK